MSTPLHAAHDEPIITGGSSTFTGGTVANATTFGSTLDVTGNTTVSANLAVGAYTTVSGNISVTGAGTVGGALSAGTLQVTGQARFNDMIKISDTVGSHPGYPMMTIGSAIKISPNIENTTDTNDASEGVFAERTMVMQPRDSSSKYLQIGAPTAWCNANNSNFTRYQKISLNCHESSGSIHFNAPATNVSGTLDVTGITTVKNNLVITDALGTEKFKVDVTTGNIMMSVEKRVEGGSTTNVGVKRRIIEGSLAGSGATQTNLLDSFTGFNESMRVVAYSLFIKNNDVWRAADGYSTAYRFSHSTSTFGFSTGSHIRLEHPTSGGTNGFGGGDAFRLMVEYY